MSQLLQRLIMFGSDEPVLYVLSYSLYHVQLWRRGMIETNISSVFGLTLIELGELTVATPIVLGLASIIALLLIHYRQHGLQQKLVSAELSMKMLKYLDENGHKDFTNLVNSFSISISKMEKIEEFNARLDRYLEIWEEIAVFCKERTITKTHRKEFFEADLKIIRLNSVVYDYLKKEHTKTTYHNLWKLMGKIWPHDS